ncbi:hypothetical protein [Corynebacterium freneyi]|uniref:RecT-like ssDNA binding protein n=1 Tax=Corynebacterium freneyi TaxID=134034 RepID=A0ABS4U8U1_9CORY|nr:hypothetical protein [Corynebacterium freneyi]MBP2333077.1 hypothetical protein [Corynebacterium freneyi]QXA52828.1 hypothetical protein I6L56_12610 [Corynebacterium freneyi]WJZ04821.1 hypothetical protein CFREN_04215 [Corynebacterium freneyi]
MTTPNVPDTAHQGEAMPLTTPSSSQALASLKEQAEAMGAAMQVAEAMCSTELVPKQYRGKPHDGAAAILYGAELGLNAIQSLQQVMVINGKPGVEARTMVGLLRAHGYRFDVTENTDTAVTVVGTAPTGETYTARWTIDMAQQAGYTKNSLYKQIPAAMLYAKSATEVCRRLGSHILSGIAYSVEELRLSEPVQAQATRADRPTAGGGAVSAIEAARSRMHARQDEQAPVDVSEMQEAPAVDAQAVIDGNAMLRELLDGLVASRSEEEMQTKVGAHVSKLGDDEAALAVLREAWTERAAEIAAEVQQ